MRKLTKIIALVLSWLGIFGCGTSQPYRRVDSRIWNRSAVPVRVLLKLGSSKHVLVIAPGETYAGTVFLPSDKDVDIVVEEIK